MRYKLEHFQNLQNFPDEIPKMFIELVPLRFEELYYVEYFLNF